MIDDTDLVDVPGPRRRSALGRSRLETLKSIRDEIAKVYRASVTGRITRSEAGTYVYQLQALALVTDRVGIDKVLELDKADRLKRGS